MSANRSVLAAQRRRAGPTNSEPAIPGRGPQPSINSSQMFANQGKPMSNLKQQQQQQQTKEGLSSVSKMTIPQAITLITLRLGSVESKLISMQENGYGLTNNMQMEGHENMVLIDKNVIQSITSRLESLEKRSSSSSGSASGPEMNLLKQQVETFKQAVMKSNSTTSNLAKENKDVKTQIDNLKGELSETKELLLAVQNLTMDNSQKLLSFSMNMGNDEMLAQDFNGQDFNGQDINGQDFNGQDFNGQDIDYNSFVENTEVNMTDDVSDKNYNNEIVTGNLKKMIENEINATI
jgi:hypothetical protein